MALLSIPCECAKLLGPDSYNTLSGNNCFPPRDAGKCNILCLGILAVGNHWNHRFIILVQTPTKRLTRKKLVINELEKMFWRWINTH